MSRTRIYNVLANLHRPVLRSKYDQVCEHKRSDQNIALFIREDSRARRTVIQNIQYSPSYVTDKQVRITSRTLSSAGYRLKTVAMT